MLPLKKTMRRIIFLIVCFSLIFIIPVNAEKDSSCSILFSLFETSYNTEEGDGKYYELFDFNEDNAIDVADFAILGLHSGDEEWCSSILKTNVLVTIESEGEDGIYTISGLVRNVGSSIAKEVYVELKSQSTHSFESNVTPDMIIYLGNIQIDDSKGYQFQIDIGENNPEGIGVFTEATGENFDETSSNIIPLPINWIVLVLFGLSILTLTKFYKK